jgi:CRP-like cAMP-binding protein
MKLLKTYCGKEWHPLIDLHRETIYLTKKSALFNYGDPVKGIYLIRKGQMKIMSGGPGEKERIIRLANDNMIVGHRGLHAESYYIRAVALQDTELEFLPTGIFKSIVAANNKLSGYLIDFLTDELQDAEERMKNLMIGDPKVRIAILLMKLVERFGYRKTEKQKLSFQLSRQDIANMAGTTYETVIRSLSHFEKSGWIAFNGKEILVRKEEALRTLAQSS